MEVFMNWGALQICMWGRIMFIFARAFLNFWHVPPPDIVWQSGHQPALLMWSKFLNAY